MKRGWPASFALFFTAGLVQCHAGPVTLAGKPVTVQIGVPQAPSAHNWTLHVEGVRANPQQGAILRIFAEFPGANRATNVDDEHFLGHITLLARAGPAARAGSNMILNVPPSAGKWFKKKRTAHITFVPMSEGEVNIGNVQLAPGE